MDTLKIITTLQAPQGVPTALATRRLCQTLQLTVKCEIQFTCRELPV